jgi:hypothetical protein
VAVQWLNQALCFYQSLCLVDSEVLRNRHLRVAAKRYSQAYYDRTGYKYEALKQGAYARRTIAYHFYSESDFLNIKKSIQKTEKVDLKFKAICSGEIFSDMEGATDTRYGTYEFNEDYAIKKFLMDKNDKYTSTNTIIINSYYLDNKMITRYRIEISSIAASVGLNQQYYECDLVNFNKLFELHSIK